MTSPTPSLTPPQRTGSLRARLLVASLAWIIVALALAGWGLRNLFSDHISQQLEAQLVLHLNQLSVAVNAKPDGSINVTLPESETRFSKPLSGLYWQVDQLDADSAQTPVVSLAAIARSRSLWDQVLPLPRIAESAQSGQNYRTLTLQDSENRALIAVTRNLQLPETNAPPLRVTVAAVRALMSEPIQRFTSMLLLTLCALALGLAIAVLIQLQFALKPLKALRQRLAEVRDGGAQRLEGPFPHELEPLVNEFNNVLSANADMIQRARTQAGNLAHAVHTPLAIMSNAAQREQGPFATLVQEQTAIAKRQIDYHLARARAASAARATGLRTPVQEPLQALVRTMQRLHADRHIHYTLAPIPATLAFRGEEQDFFELMGNLIDNAGKWAQGRVEIAASLAGPDTISLTVDDDGPGLNMEQRKQVFERGARLDEQRPGSGLGLDIVRDLAQTYGGSIEAQTSPLGGLRMQLQLPGAMLSKP